MEGMIAFLVGFPFISALLLALFKNNTVRKIVTYASSAVLIFTAILFALTYFTDESRQIFLLEEGTLFGLKIAELFEYVIIAVEFFLVVLITVLSIKYKKYYAAALSIAQTALIYWYEFSGKKPEIEVKNLYIDQLTVIMVLIVAIVGTLITVYACGYMNDYHNHHKDIKDRRSYFFAVMYIFLGAMFGLVLSNNLIWMYFFWEITSVCSFLLIGYTKTGEAITNCFRALWMNLFGGVGFAVGIVLLGIKFGITDLQSLLTMDGSLVVVPVILLGFAALTKSAQLPFSKWLLGAMVAPTPSSALLHSATMVKAGVYLLIRLAPLMEGRISGYMIGLVGGLTFLVMSMLAMTVSDGKKVLAYSTLSNLGLITACAGVGKEETVWAAIFLVIFHAVSKALLFQTVGSIEHQTGSRDIDSMHGLIGRYPTLAFTLIVGISGMFLAPFGMLVSKWAALKAFVDGGSVILVLCICFGSATTLFYWAKWLGTVLAHHPGDEIHKNTISSNQWLSLIVNSFMMIGLCFGFPIISEKIVTPYLQPLYAQTSDVIRKDNIITMIIMVALIFVIPILTYYAGVKNARLKRVSRYISGIGSPDQRSFTDSFGGETKIALSNWYLEDIFGADKVYKPSAILAIVLIAGFTVLAIVMGGGF